MFKFKPEYERFFSSRPDENYKKEYQYCRGCGRELILWDSCYKHEIFDRVTGEKKTSFSCNTFISCPSSYQYQSSMSIGHDKWMSSMYSSKVDQSGIKE